MNHDKEWLIYFLIPFGTNIIPKQVLGLKELANLERVPF